MNCPVCGLPDATSPCPRCGTDLKALNAHEARLDIVPVAPNGAGRGSPRQEH